VDFIGEILEEHMKLTKLTWFASIASSSHSHTALQNGWALASLTSRAMPASECY
jgi:hypothetical protein